MHIHGNSMNFQITGISSASAAANEAARQRAAEVRRKLMRSATEIEGEGISSPEEAFLIGQWMDSRNSQVMGEDQYHAASEGKDQDFG
jgi:hypothetical protein